MKLNIKEIFTGEEGIMKSEIRIVNISKVFVISSNYWLSLHFYDLDSKYFFTGYINNKVNKQFSKLLLSELILSLSFSRMGKIELLENYFKFINNLLTSDEYNGLNVFTLVQTIEYDPS